MFLPLVCRGRALLACSVLSVLAGCGGGTGASGGAEGPRFTSDYFPLATGDRRTWLLATNAGNRVQTHERVGSRGQIAGLEAYEVRDETGGVEYVARTGSGVFVVAGPRSEALTRAAGSVEVLRFGLAAGDSAVTFDRALSFDADGDRRDDSVQLRVTFSVVGFETVSTPAATWTQAARVRTELRTVIALASGGGGTFTSTADEWYVQGMGRVRATTVTQAGGASPQTEFEDLVAWGVGRQRSESVAPRLLSATPADNSSLSSQVPSVRLAFDEVLDPLALEGETGVRLQRSDGSVVPTRLLVLNNGKDLEIQPQDRLAEGSYLVRLGSGLVDLANNALGARDLSFTFDMTNPRLLSSQPSQDSQEAPLSGALSLTFNEDLVPVPGQTLYIEVGGVFGTPAAQRFPATLTGRTLSTSNSTQLPTNQILRMFPVGSFTDRAGNVLSVADATVTFRTDPGPLARPQPLQVGSVVFGTRLADLNGDGHVDLVFTGAEQSDSIPYLGMRPGQAGGGFGTTRRLVTLGSAQSCEARELALGDFDGDGRLDVALACGPFLRVYMQTVPGSFVMERPGWNGATGFGVGDFNGDGRVELILVGTPPGSDVGSMQAWYAISRSSSGGWTQEATLALGGSFAFPFGATFADIDNDGLPEPVWVRRDFNGRFELAWAPRLAAGFGATQAREIFTGTGFTIGLAVGDFDQDGVADAFISGFPNDGHVVMVVRGLGGGRFASPQTLVSAYSPYGMKLADMDGDGRLDLVVSHEVRTVGIYLQPTAGVFEPEREFETTAVNYINSGSLLVVDVNNDGRPDLVVQGDVLLGRPFAQRWPASGAEPGRSRAQGKPSPVRRSLLRHWGGELLN